MDPAALESRVSENSLVFRLACEVLREFKLIDSSGMLCGQARRHLAP